MKILVSDNLVLGVPSIVSSLLGGQVFFDLPYKVVGPWGPTARCLPSDPELCYSVTEIYQNMNDVVSIKTKIYGVV